MYIVIERPVMADELEHMEGKGEESAREETVEGAAAEADPVEAREKVARSPLGVGMFAIVAIVAIFAIVSGFSILQGTQKRANEARNRLASGQSALVEGDMYTALYEFTVALQLNPRIAGAHSALGEIAIANGQAGTAIDHFLAELRLSPDERTSHLALGCLYTLGVVPPGDPKQVRGYLVDRFEHVIPFKWPDELEYESGEDVDPLSEAVYHFQYAAERLPNDPAPRLGLVLTDIAKDDLEAARNRLSNLILSGPDELTLTVAQEMIRDINREEQYRLAMAGSSTGPRFVGEMPSGPTEPPPPADYSGELEPLPPMGDVGGASEPESGGFGFRTTPPPNWEPGQSRDLGLTIGPRDLLPQPSVKPVSHDIHLEESNEWVHTVRIANIYELGSVGFREGETIVMPNTNIEVTVSVYQDDLIVLEERGHAFEWVPGSVGWTLRSVDGKEVPSGTQLEVSVTRPDEAAEIAGEAPEAGGEAPESDEGESGEAGEEESEAAPDSELGPEVPTETEL